MEDPAQPNEATPPPDESVTPNPSEPDPALPPLGILVGLGQRSLTNLAGFGRYDRFSPGTEIVREGEMQDRFYVVVDGQLSVSAYCGGRDVPLNVVQAGECLCEVSLLDPGPASASIRVVQEATLWSMDIEELRSYLMAHTGDAGILLMGMASCLSYRLRRVNQLIGQHHKIPVETLPHGRERAITAGNTPVHLGFFDRIKQSLAGDKKIRISTKIKM
jgi:hypothetical protein